MERQIKSRTKVRGGVLIINKKSPNWWRESRIRNFLNFFINCYYRSKKNGAFNAPPSCTNRLYYRI